MNLLVIALGSVAAIFQAADTSRSMPHRHPSSATHTGAGAMASGTSWTPSGEAHAAGWSLGGWNVMVHGEATLARGFAGGLRSASETFSTNWLMASASRAGARGGIQLRVMGSIEPTLGPTGYPLLLQTGETADGSLPLVDRQHPHDALMEASARYDRALSSDLDGFIYLALVGEPAIGPTAFMHRRSALGNPAAPISHHFLDSTHLTTGVLTAGFVFEKRLKAEVSVFRGREQDQHRWDIERPGFDSYSLRVELRPADGWTAQTSFAQFESPEVLHPGVDSNRLTASMSHHRSLAGGIFAMTLAVGRNRRSTTLIPLDEARRTFSPAVLDHFLSASEPPPAGIPEDQLLLVVPAGTHGALLLEAGWTKGALTAFSRLEHARKDELFAPSDPRHSDTFSVKKVDAGFVTDVLRSSNGTIGIGVSGQLHLVPTELAPDYGSRPVSALMFLRVRR